MAQICLSPEAEEQWRKCCRDIEQDDGVYRNYALKPQLGLLPLERNARTGLREFVHLATGGEPKPNPYWKTTEAEQTEAKHFDRWTIQKSDRRDPGVDSGRFVPDGRTESVRSVRNQERRTGSRNHARCLLRFELRAHSGTMEENDQLESGLPYQVDIASGHHGELVRLYGVAPAVWVGSTDRSTMGVCGTRRHAAARRLHGGVGRARHRSRSARRAPWTNRGGGRWCRRWLASEPIRSDSMTPLAMSGSGARIDTRVIRLILG